MKLFIGRTCDAFPTVWELQMVKIGKIFSKPSFAWVPQGSKTFTVPSPLPVTTKITLVKFMTKTWAFQKILGSFKVKNHRNKAKKVKVRILFKSCPKMTLLTSRIQKISFEGHFKYEYLLQEWSSRIKRLYLSFS